MGTAMRIDTRLKLSQDTVLKITVIFNEDHHFYGFHAYNSKSVDVYHKFCVKEMLGRFRGWTVFNAVRHSIFLTEEDGEILRAGLDELKVKFLEYVKEKE